VISLVISVVMGVVSSMGLDPPWLDVIANPALDLGQRHRLRATDGRPAGAVGDLERATGIDQPEAEALQRARDTVGTCLLARPSLSLAPKRRPPHNNPL
jgi:hypothetical protein